ncbi:MAG TPA: hypothetical protein VJL10_03335, partial [Anaerolineales bacterium]|nr:hypothetical protein [Anaerolineales bacterium]
MRKFAVFRLPIYGGFLTLGTLLTLFISLNSPSDPKNVVLLGYSLERILLGAGLFMLAAALLALTVKLVQQPEQSQHLWDVIFKRKGFSNIDFWMAAIVFLLCWIALFLPSYRLAGNLS